MKLKNIHSRRNIARYPSFDIMYEWEDLLSSSFKLPVYTLSKWEWFIRRQIKRFRLFAIYNLFCRKQKLSLLYVMEAKLDIKESFFAKNIVPVIIDFWLKDEDIPLFLKRCKYVPFLIVTSREVYEKLLKYNTKFKIYHWALALPDRYYTNLENNTVKKYDLSILGRSNPYFERMLSRYCVNYPDFEYVKGSADITKRTFETNKGRYIGNAFDRDSYMQMVKEAKIAFYTTPGLDEAKTNSNGYNQVTPRFLELISCACHIIAHYPNNPDTEYYEMNTIVSDTLYYEDFEIKMNEYRNKLVDKEKYRSYIKKHLFSKRIEDLRLILKQEGINI